MQVDDLLPVRGVLDQGIGVADRVLEPVQARDQRSHVLGRCDRHAHLVAGHDRDVVDREHVRGIGHRDEQRALVDERDGDRLVALGGSARDQVGGTHVDAEDGEIEMIQPVALRERARQLVGCERAAFKQDPLGRRARVARGLDGLFDLLRGDEAQVDDHVGEEARG